MAVVARDRVQTADVTSSPTARRVLVSGTLEPAQTVEVGSQVSGTIASLPVDFSSRVKAGQMIARLDPASFETRLAEAAANAAFAEIPEGEVGGVQPGSQVSFAIDLVNCVLSVTCTLSSSAGNTTPSPPPRR